MEAWGDAAAAAAAAAMVVAAATATAAPPHLAAAIHATRHALPLYSVIREGQTSAGGASDFNSRPLPSMEALAAGALARANESSLGGTDSDAGCHEAAEEGRRSEAGGGPGAGASPSTEAGLRHPMGQCDNGGGGGGAVPGGGQEASGRGSTAGGSAGGGAACSRAVSRYGSLLMSSPGWRCTELFDMYDMMLLSKLEGQQRDGSRATSSYSHCSIAGTADDDKRRRPSSPAPRFSLLGGTSAAAAACGSAARTSASEAGAACALRSSPGSATVAQHTSVAAAMAAAGSAAPVSSGSFLYASSPWIPPPQEDGSCNTAFTLLASASAIPAAASYNSASSTIGAPGDLQRAATGRRAASASVSLVSARHLDLNLHPTSAAGGAASGGGGGSGSQQGTGADAASMWSAPSRFGGGIRLGGWQGPGGVTHGSLRRVGSSWGATILEALNEAEAGPKAPFGGPVDSGGAGSWGATLEELRERVTPRRGSGGAGLAAPPPPPGGLGSGSGGLREKSRRLLAAPWRALKGHSGGSSPIPAAAADGRGVMIPDTTAAFQTRRNARAAGRDSISLSGFVETTAGAEPVAGLALRHAYALTPRADADSEAPALPSAGPVPAVATRPRAASASNRPFGRRLFAIASASPRPRSASVHPYTASAHSAGSGFVVATEMAAIGVTAAAAAGGSPPRRASSGLSAASGSGGRGVDGSDCTPSSHRGSGPGTGLGAAAGGAVSGSGASPPRAPWHATGRVLAPAGSRRSLSRALAEAELDRANPSATPSEEKGKEEDEDEEKGELGASAAATARPGRDAALSGTPRVGLEMEAAEAAARAARRAAAAAGGGGPRSEGGAAAACSAGGAADGAGRSATGSECGADGAADGPSASRKARLRGFLKSLLGGKSSKRNRAAGEVSDGGGAASDLHDDTAYTAAATEPDCSGQPSGKGPPLKSNWRLLSAAAAAVLKRDGKGSGGGSRGGSLFEVAAPPALLAVGEAASIEAATAAAPPHDLPSLSPWVASGGSYSRAQRAAGSMTDGLRGKGESGCDCDNGISNQRFRP
ncbi:hypothetical protein GPECTOR_26g617 [Gonium pectorale]|uniref:Uncharacterized protein n=1 Tax=Gonium pectorale TaxID=33097 RepID=A0A150GFW9_GONPE|nr:hypothetical protein GPECTOR_26g617 [Gonium pectorale]|eukprot:KXZ48714.1 hypothetical protein GPECTOR_26g617 [Gonium pectorale]